MKRANDEDREDIFRNREVGQKTTPLSRTAQKEYLGSIQVQSMNQERTWGPGVS